jgi:hypothetical protein
LQNAALTLALGVFSFDFFTLLPHPSGKSYINEVMTLNGLPMEVSHYTFVSTKQNNNSKNQQQ